VLDIQTSQRSRLVAEFPQITLFPNVRARIQEIDGVNIQDALARDDGTVDRELGREFNLTYRDALLPSERVVEGLFSVSRTTDMSIEEEFAKRVGIQLGSSVLFTVQGIPISAMVTSIREVDTRSGYPFFYFVSPPRTLSAFPTTYFGYVDADEGEQKRLRGFLAETIPNASLIDTSAITKRAEEIIDVLLVVILGVTIPPILLSLMLILTILASLATERKRDGARLLALGKRYTFVRAYFIGESILTTCVASLLAYVCAIIGANVVVRMYLNISNSVYYDAVSLYMFGALVAGLVVVSGGMWRQGKRHVRDYLTYEENN
jgi:putative ABC transport system permease protein